MQTIHIHNKGSVGRGGTCASDCSRLGCVACMTMVRVGWSQLPLSASSIIILLTTLCTCAHSRLHWVRTCPAGDPASA